MAGQGSGSAGRVIAGSARGIRLTGAGPETRALSDRVKETLFAILEPDLREARFLDLFAGTGAAAIEALSRGAGLAVLVERSAGIVRVIEANLAAARVASRARVIRADVTDWLARPEAATLGPFDVVLVDPPYDHPDLLRGALGLIAARSAELLAPDATVVAKHFWRETPPRRIGLLASARERRFGETTLTFYRLELAVGSEREEQG